MDSICLKRKEIELPSTCGDESGQVCIDISVNTYPTLEELENIPSIELLDIDKTQPEENVTRDTVYQISGYLAINIHLKNFAQLHKQVKNFFKRPDKVLYLFYVVKSHSYVRFCRWFLTLRRLNLLALSNHVFCPLERLMLPGGLFGVLYFRLACFLTCGRTDYFLIIFSSTLTVILKQRTRTCLWLDRLGDRHPGRFPMIKSVKGWFTGPMSWI